MTDVPTEFGEGADRVQVVLTQRAASLTGVVTTAAGGAIQGSVVVLSDDPALWHERASSTAIVPTAADGKYRVEGLRAGRYLIVAIPKEEPPAPSLTPSLLRAARETCHGVDVRRRRIEDPRSETGRGAMRLRVFFPPCQPCFSFK